MTWSKWWTPARPSPTAGRRGPLSRRAFLGGGAVAVSLPLLESLVPKAWAGGAPPVRLLFYYAPCGIHMPAWTPSGTGANYDLPTILQPLAPVQSDVMVLTGLANRAASVPVAGDHARGTGSFLTCTTVEHTSDEGQISNGISVDQVMAQAVGDQTLFPSLELGLVGGAPVGDCDSGYSCAYARNIAWAGPSTPVAKQTDPRLVFDRLFSGFDTSLSQEDIDRRKRWRTSVLDHVTGEVNSLNPRLSRSDRAKLDEFLTGVRALETRLASDLGGECLPGDEPDAGMPYEVAASVMNQLMVTALECDLTRVASFMLENAGSYRAFDFLGVPRAHHEISHHQGDPANHADLVTIDRWEIEQFTDLLTRMRGVTELDGSTLLDNSLVMFSSEISDGDRHNHDDLPVLLAGRGGGYLAQSGRHKRFASEQPIADLYVAMLEAAGVSVPSFGMDGTGALDLS